MYTYVTVVSVFLARFVRTVRFDSGAADAFRFLLLSCCF